MENVISACQFTKIFQMSVCSIMDVCLPKFWKMKLKYALPVFLVSITFTIYLHQLAFAKKATTKLKIQITGLYVNLNVVMVFQSF